MKVLMYQAYSVNNLALFQLTHGNHVQYAAKRGYSLFCDDTPYSPYLDTKKIRALLSTCDLLVTVGSDCVFTDFDRDVTEFFSDRTFGAAACIEGTKNSLFNGEILLLRNTANGHEWLDCMEQVQAQFPDTRWGFQSCLNRMFKMKLPGWQYLYPIPAGTLQRYFAAGSRFEPYAWRPGDFLAHTLGGTLADKLKFCREILILSKNLEKRADIVIPLGPGSKFGNDELRLALRSIEAHFLHLGTVWIVSTCAPDWLRNVRVLPVADTHTENKDANLFDKLKFAAECPAVTEDFCFVSDDQAFFADYDPFHAPTVRGKWGREHFAESGGGKWHARMLHTFDYLAERGVTLDLNLDAHVPVMYTKTDFRRALEGVDYVTAPGFCINTLVCGLTGRTGDVDMTAVKVTAESGDDLRALAESGCAFPDTARFIGYNDDGFIGGFREALFHFFPKKSKFEA